MTHSRTAAATSKQPSLQICPVQSGPSVIATVFYLHAGSARPVTCTDLQTSRGHARQETVRPHRKRGSATQQPTNICPLASPLAITLGSAARYEPLFGRIAAVLRHLARVQLDPRPGGIERCRHSPVLWVLVPAQSELLDSLCGHALDSVKGPGC